jgi:hypothetical protein
VTLFQVANLTELPNPENESLNRYKHWLVHPDGANKFLHKSEALTWTPDDFTKDDMIDFISLANPGGENDGFSRWMKSKPLQWFHGHIVDPLKRKMLSKEENERRFIDPETGMVNYDDSTLEKISIFVATFISLIFPIGAILALYFVKDTLQRIGIMIGFTTAFGLALTFFTITPRIGIFSTTAA